MAGIKGSNGDSTASAGRITNLNAQVGLSGRWKVGHPTAVHVTANLEGGELPSGAMLEIRTIDGEGVDVAYREKLAGGGQDALKIDHWSYVSIGRADASLTISVLDGQETVLSEVVLSGDKITKGEPATQLLVVALGNSLGIEATARANAGSGLASFSTSVLEDVSQVPNDWQAYSAVDLLIVATSGGQPLAAKLNDSHWKAVRTYVERGGNCLISVGENALKLPADSLLLKMLPGEFEDVLNQVNPGPLEATTSTDTPLQPITAARMKNVHGTVELALIDRSGKTFPWWIRYPIGRGFAQFIGSDLDSEILRNWKDRRLIWEKLLISYWTKQESADALSEQDVSGATYLGYDDLVGQLRATLDFFPDARVVSFGQVTFILIAILILVGPIDYWLCVRWLKRPDLSWFVAGTILLASAVGLVLLERAARPKELLLNRATIVDYLPVEKQLVSQQWMHIYSSRARQVDTSLSLPGSASLPRLDWQGLPGRGLGGMESNLVTDRGLPGYQIRLGDQPTATSIALSASGTKCLTATWFDHFEPTATSQLTETQGIDQVAGSIANPLAVDLLDASLLYHNWYYKLPTRIKAGGSVALTYDFLPKDLSRRLNRRHLVNTSEVVTPWDSADRESLDRLLEMMMFYKVGGGLDYVKLGHRFQPMVDSSNMLKLDIAVLFGRLEQSPGKILVNVPDNEARENASETWCRVFIPVQSNSRK